MQSSFTSRDRRAPLQVAPRSRLTVSRRLKSSVAICRMGPSFLILTTASFSNRSIWWSTAHRVADLAFDLDLIKDPTQWWAYLQGGIRQISENDYNTITLGSPKSSPRTSQEHKSKTLFALDAHLEDFIAQNWAKISWGASLELYRDGDQNGRQFPAGRWSIDFLAIDSARKELVVIQLKRGQSSDATIGQVLRYITWVREHIAVEGQTVRGIVIAGAVDDLLRYAAKAVPQVSIATYIVNFGLNCVKL